MEFGTIEKQIRIAAPAAVVYEVISSPEHISRWWAEGAELSPTPGRPGVLVFHDKQVCLTVVEAVPGQRFAFRWNYPEGHDPTPQNSMLVTFALTPDEDGTVLSVTEEGMREQGWEAAVLEEYYSGHERGWATCLADLADYVTTLPVQR